MDKIYGSESKFEFAIIKKDQDKKMQEAKLIKEKPPTFNVFVVYKIEKHFNQLGFLRRISSEVLGVFLSEESLREFLKIKFSSLDRLIDDFIKKETYSIDNSETHEFVWNLKIIDAK